MVFFIVRFGDNVVFKSPLACIEDSYSTVVDIAKYFKIPMELLTCKFVIIDDVFGDIDELGGFE